MEIYSINSLKYNRINFCGLKIKDVKKWPKEELELIQNNSEVKKLVADAEKEGIDVMAEYYRSHNMYSSSIVRLKNSYDYTFGYFSIDSFRYDIFRASNYKLQIKNKGFETNISENKTGALHITKTIYKSLKDYAKNKFSKLKIISKK